MLLLLHEAQKRSVRLGHFTPTRVAIITYGMLAMAIFNMNAADNTDESKAQLTVERIYSAKEFGSQKIDLMVWSRSSASYYTASEITPADDPSGSKSWDIVRVDVVSGKRETLIAAKDLVVAGNEKPLAVEGIQLSENESSLLIYTNSQRVWRQKTRGDYWSINLATNELKKIGGDVPAATLMFAKFSPDGTRVSYVQNNNLYVQDLGDLRIHQLTSDGSARIINGTADWVNEEELGIRDGYRWSPDGQTLAFWQFDTTGVPEFSLIDNTAGLYPRVTSFAYPKVGQVNSATRIGLVSASGGAVRWLAAPGDPRQHYVPEVEWSPDSKHVMLQQLNRLQNTNLVMLGDPQTGAIRTVLTETDAAWLENENPVKWVNSGRQFLWLSDRDGWRHAYVANTDGGACTLV